MERYLYDEFWKAYEDTLLRPAPVRYFREVVAHESTNLVTEGKRYPVGGFVYTSAPEYDRVLIGTIYDDGTLPSNGISMKILKPVYIDPTIELNIAAETARVEEDRRREQALLHDAAQKLLAVNGKSTNPKEAIGSTKIPFHMIPAGPLAWMAMAFYEGGTKYGPYNWRVAGVRASTYVSAVMRHLEKWWNGHDTDPATRVHHLANAMAGLAIILDAELQGMLTDDRPPKQDLEALFAKLADVQAHLTELNKGANPPNYTEVEHGKKS